MISNNPGTGADSTTTVTGTVAISQTGTDNDVDANVTNGSGASAVNIQDGGNSITVDGSVSVNNFPATQTVALSQSGTDNNVDANITNASLAVTGPLTDTELRASPVPVSGTVSVNEPVSVDDNGGSLTVDGTVAVTQSTSPWVIGDGGSSISVDDSGGSLTVDGTITANAGSGTFVVGDGGSSISIDDNGGSVTVDGSLTITDSGNTTATRTNVARSASNQTLLASNTGRKGATIYNDSNSTLYVKFGTTASTTDFTVALDQADYYEIPFHYSGRIDGIWGSAGAGNARMTEITA